MKTTVWTLTTEDGGTYTGVYGSEAAANAALREVFGADGSLDNIPDNELADVICKPSWEGGIGGVFYLDSQEIELPDPKPDSGAHAWLSRKSVLQALNQACDDIIDAAGLTDEGTVNALNLMVNAAHDYLFDPTVEDLSGVIANNYDAEYDEVIGWIE